jgi:phosphoribosylformylglycinamidine synthase
VVLLGDNRGELGGSEYLAHLHNTVAGPAPELDLAREKALQQLVVRAVRDGLVESAHDCAEGGLAVTLAECCFDTQVGVSVDLPGVANVPAPFRVNATLFGESASRVVVSVRPENVDALHALAAACGVPAVVIGQTGGERVTLRVDGAVAVDVAVAQAETEWATAIERKMAR